MCAPCYDVGGSPLTGVIWGASWLWSFSLTSADWPGYLLPLLSLPPHLFPHPPPPPSPSLLPLLRTRRRGKMLLSVPPRSGTTSQYNGFTGKNSKRVSEARAPGWWWVEGDDLCPTLVRVPARRAVLGSLVRPSRAATSPPGAAARPSPSAVAAASWAAGDASTPQPSHAPSGYFGTAELPGSLAHSLLPTAASPPPPPSPPPAVSS